ncbi:thiolase C-terminal domain-containing protein [Aquabacterium sp.]|uniref:thiolase C-terminal domain-containing protein n=1 Tax=Aquabacterium sp. TaxID=1872578 RepID=UPI002B6060EE|nr:lipid-transfer protein [Aquabacterium sp.]HSW04939.1 lipid-transfer protein [Aquabacterium sp.]
MTEKPQIAGVGMVRFTKAGRSAAYDAMAAEAARAALADAGIAYAEVQQAYVGFVIGDTTSGQQSLYPLGLSGIPIINVNNACATGSSALFLARQAVASGVVDVALALGFEQMLSGPLASPFNDRPGVNGVLNSMVSTVQGWDAKAPIAAQYFGGAGREYQRKYGPAKDLFARISVKSRAHAARNPLAVFREPTTVEEVLASPPVFADLTRLQCCPPTCGAAAAVVVSADYARRKGLLGRCVAIAGQALTTDGQRSFDAGSMIAGVGADMTRRAAQQAYAQAGIGPDELQVVELHDCFTPNEIISYEALGLCPEGGAEKFVRDGDNTYGGRVVTNPSGGLLSKGHPLGATGLAQTAEIVWQLRGEAGERQVPGARAGLQHNVGLGGACVVTVLAR